jgi:hypothetical protein
MVEPLAEKLNGRLSEILFLLGHVQIINKDAKLLARRRTENTFTSLLKFLIKSILDLVSTGLSGESQRNSLVVLRHFLVQHVCNIDSFTGTSRTRGKNVLSVTHEQFLDVFHADRIESGHNDFRVGMLLVNFERLHGVGPNDPLLGFLVEAVVVASALVGELELVVFAHDFTKFHIKFVSAISSGGAASGPDSRENEEGFDH